MDIDKIKGSLDKALEGVVEPERLKASAEALKAIEDGKGELDKAQADLIQLAKDYRELVMKGTVKEDHDPEHSGDEDSSPKGKDLNSMIDSFVKENLEKGH